MLEQRKATLNSIFAGAMNGVVVGAECVVDGAMNGIVVGT